MSINSVVVSGTIRKAFDSRTLDSGSVTQTYALQFKSGTKDKQIMVGVFTDDEDDERLGIEEGSYVIVQGRLHEQNWQDKESKEWHNRHEVQATKILQVAEIESDEDDDPFGDDE